MNSLGGEAAAHARPPSRGRMEHAKRAEEYLTRAEECALASKVAATDEAKVIYMKMAELFHALAEQESKLMGSGLPLI